VSRQAVGHFELMDFSDGPELSLPVFTGSTMRIPVRRVTLWKGHPFAGDSPRVVDGTLIFEGVTRSVRHVRPYSDPLRPSSLPRDEMFRPEIVQEDGPFARSSEPSARFDVDGVFVDPHGPVCWQIDAISFAFDLDIQ
jgi:hypothetical protein